MASQLKNILNFVGVPAGAAISLPHNLNWSGLAVVPDYAVADQDGWEITADATNVTIKGVGGDVDVLVESWHTIEREFGSSAITKLSPQPFVPASGDEVPTPPYELEMIFIYATATGSDTTGDGSQANPYQTFQRAIRDVPNIIAPGRIYTVDVTNLGIETFPSGYQMPVILAPAQYVFSAGLPPEPTASLPFSVVTPLNIRAIPQPASVGPAAEMSLAPGDYTSAADPNTGLITLTLTGPMRPSWGGSRLKGKMLLSADSTANCAIYDSTTTTISLCHTAAVAGQVNIVEPSATFHTLTTNPDGSGELGGGFECNNTTAVAFQGIKFICDDPNPFASALGLFSQLFPYVEMCDVDGISTSGGYPGVNFTNTVFRTKNIATVPASIFATGCLFLGIQFFSIAGSGANFFVGSVFDGCTTFSSNPGLFTPLGTMVSLSWEVINCLFKNSTGIGIWMRGDPWVVISTQIDGAAGDAILVDGGQVRLVGVTGTGSTGIGIHADVGAQVGIDATTNVTGSTPGTNDVKSGSLAATSYATQHAHQQYDIPPNSASVDVATGARIYNA